MTREFRPRYILFSISADKKVFPIQRHQLIAALQSYCSSLHDCSLKDKKIYLTRFNGEKGIVRCKHTEKKATIQLLESIKKINHNSVDITTIATSGTIKSLIKKHDKDNALRN